MQQNKPQRQRRRPHFLAEWMAHAGVSNADVISATGAGKDLVSKWKNKGVVPTEEYLEALAELLGTTREGIFHRPGWVSDEDRGDQPETIMVVPGFIDVPRVTWITAGELGSLDAFDPLEAHEYPTVSAADLPAGRYIALKVEADAASMNKISPPESVIFVNLDDRRLIPNACYVVADEQGRATYKRYRPGAKPEFQPASYDAVKPPKLEGAITVIGRVRRSMIDM